jgi:hypothetical protein
MANANGERHIMARRTRRRNRDMTTVFAAGTRILTARGEIAVEILSIGDAVETVSGVFRPLVFLGRRRVECARHPEPRHVCPVRVRAGAFADGLPSRDLRLSPNHAVYLDDVLIPIRSLVDGMTIVQETIDEVVYWQVELPEQNVIFAEGLPCDSCPDAEGRTAFENGGAVVQLHPRFTSYGDAVRRPPIDVEALTRIRRYLLDRSALTAVRAVSTSV